MSVEEEGRVQHHAGRLRTSLPRERRAEELGESNYYDAVLKNRGEHDAGTQA